MNANLGLRPKPEEEELKLKKQELQALESRLIDDELQLAGLRGELSSFEQRYLKEVGTRYAELDEIEAQIAEFVAKRNPGNLKAQGTAREARARVNMDASDLVVKEATTRFSPSSSLKDLYRAVARRIHPDLAVDEADRAKRQKLMAEVNRAYENGDEAKLRAILEEYESSPEAVSGEGAGVELVRIIRKIAQVRRRLNEICEELDELRASDLFELKKKVDEGVKLGRDVLSEMAARINSQIDERRGVLSTLLEEIRK